LFSKKIKTECGKERLFKCLPGKERNSDRCDVLILQLVLLLLLLLLVCMLQTAS